MLGSTTSRRNFSTASRSSALNPKVATSKASRPLLSDALCGKAAESAKPNIRRHNRALRGLEAHASSRRLTRTGLPVLAQSGRSSGVEHNLAKVGVEGSNPFARSRFPLSIFRTLESFSGAPPQTATRRFEPRRPLDILQLPHADLPDHFGNETFCGSARSYPPGAMTQIGSGRNSGW